MMMIMTTFETRKAQGKKQADVGEGGGGKSSGNGPAYERKISN